MKKIIFLFIFVLLIGCSKEPLVGNDKDEHGCIGSAGYVWCESKQTCLRAWEEYCEEYSEMFNENASIDSFEDCANAGYSIMESYPRQCNANGNNYVEEI